MKRTHLISLSSLFLILCVLHGPLWSQDICGGIAGIGCPSLDDFCEFPPGTCNIADNQGVCVETPDACPLVWDPVCGCDGVTYGNDCERQMAHVSKEHDGPCVQICQDNSECGSGEYCAKDPGVCDNEAGTCEVQPQICPEIYDPVCGCDGNTYDNACQAAAAGMNVASDGECPQVCGGFIGIPCNGPDQFCEYPPGTCNFADHFGACAVIPDACLAVWDPVCGCDGVTYGNDCERQMALVSKDHDGPCGTPCQSNADCSANNQYCAKGVGVCDNGAGSCQPRPQACPQVYDPVCGCDGNTYGNACDAASAGVNIASEGECPQVCGGFAGIPCHGPDQFCEFPPGTCNFADHFGGCVVIPQACPDIWDPVCGCDGVTYSNDCDRRAAQVSKAHDGPCCPVAILCAPGYVPVDTDGDGCDDACKKPCVTFCDCLGLDFDEPCPLLCPNCGNFWTCDEGLCEENCGQIPPDYHTTCNEIICQDNSDCLSSDQYCAKEPGVCDNGTGICESRPLGCPDVWDPVCGCDGNTYSNSCDAMAVGVNVAHPGECQPDCAPCLDKEDCGDTEFCLKAPGECKRAGTCRPRPQHCPLFFDPVCGCDGRTYSNGCDAHANGASIAHKGPCVHPMCVDRPPMDYNGDCRVTVIDFAIFANHWFDCGMVPASACWQ